MAHRQHAETKRSTQVIFNDMTPIILTYDDTVLTVQKLCSLKHCDLSSAVVQAMCTDDDEEADTTIEQAQMAQDRPSTRRVL